MYVYDQSSSRLEERVPRRPLVLPPSQSARFYPLQPNLGAFDDEPGGALTMRPKPSLTLDRFGFNKVWIPTLHKSRLQTLAKHVVDSQQSTQRVVRIRLVGHTDEIGTDTYNEKLGLQRANSVKAVLEKEIENRSPGLLKGINQKVEIITESRGEKEPLTSERSKRRFNRRVEVFLTMSRPQIVTPNGTSTTTPPPIDLWKLPKSIQDHYEEQDRREAERRRLTQSESDSAQGRSLGDRARAKAIDFLREKGLSKKNAERAVDLAGRGAKPGLKKLLEELDVGPAGRDAILNGLQRILQIEF